MVSKKKLEKKADLDGGKEGGTGRNTGRGNYNQNIVYEKGSFFNKRKKGKVKKKRKERHSQEWK